MNDLNGFLERRQKLLKGGILRSCQAFLLVAIVLVPLSNLFLAHWHLGGTDHHKKAHWERKARFMAGGGRKLQQPRECTNPEASLVKNPYTGRCPNPGKTVTWTNAMSGFSRTSQHKCIPVQCKQTNFTRYLTRVSDVIRKNSAADCNVTMYSVLFGEDYKVTRGSTALSRTRENSRLCKFLFLIKTEHLTNMTAVSGTKGSLWRDKHDPTTTYVGVPASILPYENMKQNVNLFKLNGPQIFAWTNHLIWIDGDMRRNTPLSSFEQYYDKTGIADNVCVVYVAMPKHTHTIGPGHKKLTKPTYKRYAERIMSDLENNPNITNAEEKLVPIRFLRDKAIPVNKKMRDTKHQHGLTLDDLLVDTGMIAWNQRDKDCKVFNTDLSCTLLSETQCYSEIEQLSLPFVLHSMNLERQGDDHDDAVDRSQHDLILVDNEKKKPMVGIVRAACHWLLKPTIDCVLAQDDR